MFTYLWASWLQQWWVTLNEERRERRKGPLDIILSLHIPTNLKLIIFVYFLPCCEERKRIFRRKAEKRSILESLGM